MNIFVLDTNPRLSAIYHNDKHVVKMSTETVQIVCTVLHRLGLGSPSYKATHPKHPCVLWALESVANLLWLIEFGEALLSEYTYRYGKVHKSVAVLAECKEILSSCLSGSNHLSEEAHLFLFKNTIQTAFVQCMPDECKKSDTVEAYRMYYQLHKSHIATWKNRQPPFWWV